MSEPVLTTERLSIGYQQRRDQRVSLAAALNLHLPPGELVCLLGPNGVGKSTLLRTLAGMQAPLSGRVLLGGQDVRTLRPRDLALRLSIVLTGAIDVGNLSAYALVSLGRHPHTGWMGALSPHDETIVQQALESVGAAHLSARPIHELSDGERQRVMIARALAQEPLLMILDEPTAFLDLPGRVEIMRLLRHLAHTTGRALLLSTHDLDLALRSADLLWLMAPGQHLFTGAPEDLVLSGAFETTFQREGISFDVTTGAFQGHAPPRGKVGLVGNGLPTTWTARALERGGFAVVQDDEQVPVHIAVSPHNGTLHWQTMVYGEQYTHTSLYEMLAFLRRERG